MRNAYIQKRTVNALILKGNGLNWCWYITTLSEIMRKYYIIVLSLFYFDSFGQIFNHTEVMPGIKTMKTKQFNGCGVGYWNLKYYDQKGRMIIEELNRENTLLGKHAFAYDEWNNELYFISLYDINNPGVIDTVSTNEYKYDQNGEIIKEISVIGTNTYTTERIDISSNETTYRLISKIIWQHRDTINFDTTSFKLVYNVNHLIEKQIKEDIENGIFEIKEFQYYNDGNLKRRKVTRVPEPEIHSIYVGWPGSDNMGWEYKFDQNKRIKKLFSLVDGKKYKLEKYEYEEW